MQKHSNFSPSNHYFHAREFFRVDKHSLVGHRRLKTRQRLVYLFGVFKTEYRYRSKWLFVFSSAITVFHHPCPPPLFFDLQIEGSTHLFVHREGRWCFTEHKTNVSYPHLTFSSILSRPKRINTWVNSSLLVDHFHFVTLSMTNEQDKLNIDGIIQRLLECKQASVLSMDTLASGLCF